MREKIEQLLQDNLSAEEIFTQCDKATIPDEDFIFLCEKMANTSRDMVGRWEQFTKHYPQKTPLQALFCCIIDITSTIRVAQSQQQTAHERAIRQFLITLKKEPLLQDKARRLLSLWHTQLVDVSLFLAAKTHYLATLANPIILAYLDRHATLDILQRTLLASMLQPDVLAAFINDASEVPEDIVDELYKKIEGLSFGDYSELIKSKKKLASILFVHQIKRTHNHEAKQNLLTFVTSNTDKYDWNNRLLYQCVHDLIPEALPAIPHKAAQLLVDFCSNEHITHDQSLLADSLFRLSQKPDIFVLFWTMLQKKEEKRLDETRLSRQLLIQAIRKSPAQLMRIIEPLATEQKIRLFTSVYQDCLALGGQGHLDLFLKSCKQSMLGLPNPASMFELLAGQIFELEKQDIILCIRTFFTEISSSPQAMPLLKAFIQHEKSPTDLLTNHFWQICDISPGDIIPLINSLTDKQALTVLMFIGTKQKPAHFQHVFQRLSSPLQVQLLQDCPSNILPAYYEYAFDHVPPDTLWQIALGSAEIIRQNNTFTPAQKALFMKLAKHIRGDECYSKAGWMASMNAGALALLFFRDPILLQAAWSPTEVRSEYRSWLTSFSYVSPVLFSAGQSKSWKSFGLDVLECLYTTKQLTTEMLLSFFIAYQHQGHFLADFFKCCSEILDKKAPGLQKAIEHFVHGIRTFDSKDRSNSEIINLQNCKESLKNWSSKSSCDKLIDNAKTISLKAWEEASSRGLVPVYFQDISEKDFLALAIDKQWRVFTQTHSLVDLQNNRQKLEHIYHNLPDNQAMALQSFILDDRHRLSQSQSPETMRLHFHFFCSLPQTQRKIQSADLATIRPALNLCTCEDSLDLLAANFDHWQAHTPENAAEILNLCFQKADGQISTQQYIIRFAKDTQSLMRIGNTFRQLPESSFFALSDTLIGQIKLLRPDERRHFVESMVSLETNNNTNTWHLLILVEELADGHLPEPQNGHDELVNKILAYLRRLFDWHSRKDNVEGCTSILQQLNVICRLLMDKDTNWFARLLENEDFVWLGKRWLTQANSPQKHLHPLADFITKYPLSYKKAPIACDLLSCKAGQELISDCILNNPWAREDNLLRLAEFLDLEQASLLLTQLFELIVVSPAHENLMATLARKLPVEVLLEVLRSQKHTRVAVLCLFEHPQFTSLSDEDVKHVWSTAQNWYLLSKYLSEPLDSEQKNRVAELFVHSNLPELAQSLLNHCPSGSDFAWFLARFKASSPYSTRVLDIIQNAPLHHKHIEAFLSKPRAAHFVVPPGSSLAELVRIQFLQDNHHAPLHPSFWDSIDKATLAQKLPYLQKSLQEGHFFKNIFAFINEHRDSLKDSLQTAWWWSDLDFIILAQSRWTGLVPSTRKNLSSASTSPDKPWVFLGDFPHPQKALEPLESVLDLELPGISMELTDCIKNREATLRRVLSERAVELFSWGGSLHFCHKMNKLPQDFPIDKLLTEAEQHWQQLKKRCILQWQALFTAHPACLNTPKHMDWFIGQFLPVYLHDKTGGSWLDPSVLPRLNLDFVNKSLVSLSEKLWSSKHEEALRALSHCKNTDSLSQLPEEAMQALTGLCNSLNLQHFAKLFNAVSEHRKLMSPPPLFSLESKRLVDEIVISSAQIIIEARKMARSALREMQYWVFMPEHSDEATVAQQFAYYRAFSPELLETETFITLFIAYLKQSPKFAKDLFVLLRHYKEKHPTKYNSLWQALRLDMKENLARLICTFDSDLVFHKDLLKHLKTEALLNLCAPLPSDSSFTDADWELAAQKSIWQRTLEGSRTEPETLRALGLVECLFKHISVLRHDRQNSLVKSSPENILIQKYYVTISAPKFQSKSIPTVHKNSSEDEVLFLILRRYLLTFQKEELCKTSAQWFLKLDKPSSSKAFQTLWQYLIQENVLAKFLEYLQLERPSLEQADWLLKNLPDSKSELRDALFLSMPISFCLRQNADKEAVIKHLSAKLNQLQDELNGLEHTRGFTSKALEKGAEVLKVLLALELDTTAHQKLLAQTQNAPTMQGLIFSHIFKHNPSKLLNSQLGLLTYFEQIYQPWDIRAVPEEHIRTLSIPGKLALLCNPISCKNLLPDTVSDLLNSPDVLRITIKFWLSKLADFPYLGNLLLALNTKQLSITMDQYPEKRGAIFNALYEAMPFWNEMNIEIWLEYLGSNIPTEDQLAKLLYYFQSSKNIAVLKALKAIIPKLDPGSFSDTSCLVALYEFCQENMTEQGHSEQNNALALTCIEKTAALGQLHVFTEKPGLLKDLFAQPLLSKAGSTRSLRLSTVFFENLSTAHLESLSRLCQALLEFGKDTEALAQHLHNPRVHRLVKETLCKVLASAPKSTINALVEVANYDHTLLIRYCTDLQLEQSLPDIIAGVDAPHAKQALGHYLYEYQGQKYIEQISGLFKSLRQWFWRCWYFGFSGFFKPNAPSLYEPHAIKNALPAENSSEIVHSTPWEWLIRPKIGQPTATVYKRIDALRHLESQQELFSNPREMERIEEDYKLLLDLEERSAIVKKHLPEYRDFFELNRKRFTVYCLSSDKARALKDYKHILEAWSIGHWLKDELNSPKTNSALAGGYRFFGITSGQKSTNAPDVSLHH